MATAISGWAKQEALVEPFGLVSEMAQQDSRRHSTGLSGNDGLFSAVIGPLCL
jgi:hypothetical protein